MKYKITATLTFEIEIPHNIKFSVNDLSHNSIGHPIIKSVGQLGFSTGLFWTEFKNVDLNPIMVNFVDKEGKKIEKSIFNRVIKNDRDMIDEDRDFPLLLTIIPIL